MISNVVIANFHSRRWNNKLEAKENTIKTWLAEHIFNFFSRETWIVFNLTGNSYRKKGIHTLPTE